MKPKPAMIVLLVVGLLALSGLVSQANAAPSGLDVAASPAVLNLNSSGGAVSLHTDVGYGSVTSVALAVDGAPVTQFYTFSDARGQLVVRCDIELIKSMVGCPAATYELDVTTISGSLSGTDTIRVIDVGH